MKKKNKLKEFLKKFWFIIWKDESFKGWIISMVFLFILIKFIFFPTLSFLTGTSIPLVIVESCSMYHEGNIFSSYNNWFDRHETKYSNLNITKEEFKKFSLKKGFSKGDILLLTNAKPEKLEIGDIIIFDVNSKTPIIHRIILIKKEGDKFIFSTIGDNNNGQIYFEKEITEDQLLAKARTNLVPFFGWIKLIFYEPFQPKSNKGFCKEN